MPPTTGKPRVGCRGSAHTESGSVAQAFFSLSQKPDKKNRKYLADSQVFSIKTALFRRFFCPFYGSHISPWKGEVLAYVGRIHNLKDLKRLLGQLKAHHREPYALEGWILEI